MTFLPDVNVLVALAWRNHIHHRAALRWFSAHQGEGWATCPLTQSGFVRVSSNVRVIPQARSPAEAIAVLRRMTALPHHHFWEDDISLADCPWIAPELIAGYHQVTDAHLLALAVRHGGRLATFDGGIVDLVPPFLEPGDAVVLLEPRPGF